MDAIDAIAITEAKLAAEGKGTLEERLEVAMHATKNHWLLTDEDRRFTAAIGGVLLVSNEEEQERIKVELGILRALSAACSGAPMDMTALPDPDEYTPVGLQKMWKRIKGD